MPKSVVFIGGTGIISRAAVAEAVSRGLRVIVLNRGRSRRELPEGVETRVADIHDPESVRAAVRGLEVDTVADFLAFTPEEVLAHTALFAGVAAQYLFISSASAYQKPPQHVPVTESTPLDNPFWRYSQLKAQAEQQLPAAAQAAGLEYTIVRPSHTYDERSLPFEGGWAVVDRMRRGLPVIVPGDGTSLWTITHARDVARWFVPLLGEPRAYGEAFHITGDEAPAWNAIYRAFAAAAGVDEPRLVHIASDAIAAVDAEWGASLLGDKAHSMLFDNTKVRAIAPQSFAFTPLADGVREVVAWHDADASRREPDAAFDALCDRLIERYGVVETI